MIPGMLNEECQLHHLWLQEHPSLSEDIQQGAAAMALSCLSCTDCLQAGMIRCECEDYHAVTTRRPLDFDTTLAYLQKTTLACEAASLRLYNGSDCCRKRICSLPDTSRL